MKNILLFLCIVSNYCIAQVPMALSPDANEFYNKAMPLIKPQLKKIIIESAAVLKNRQANADSLSKALKKNPVLKSMSNENIEGITTLIMVQASIDADEDMKKMVLSMRNNNETQDKNLSNKKNQSPAEMNDKKQTALQTIIHRKGKIAEEVSLVMKRINDNKESIITNLQ